MNWLILSAVTLLSWGLWALLNKIALKHMSWQQVYVVSIFVSIGGLKKTYTMRIAAIDTKIETT